jgi:hypothetical protein
MKMSLKLAIAAAMKWIALIWIGGVIMSADYTE